MGLPACAVGQGISAAVLFEDPRLSLEFGSIVLSRPLAGRVRFIWQSGDDIAAISDIHIAAEIIREVVNASVGPTQDRNTSDG